MQDRKNISRIDNMIERLYGKITVNQRTAFLSAIIIGLIAHLYMFTNKLPNYDDILINSFGATFRLGRWFLWVLGAIAYHLDLVYSLPWVNGLVSLLLLAVAAMLMVDVLKIKSKISVVIISGIFVVFPSWTATFFFMFTAPFYALAVFLIVLSVYLNVKFKYGYIFGIMLLALSLGIYQAYLPFAATFYVVVLIMEIGSDNGDYILIWKKAFKYLFTILAGVLLYYAIMKLSLIITNQQLADYKGVGQMGALSASMLPDLVKNIINNGFGIVVNNNLEISYNLLLKAGYAWLYFVDFVLGVMLVIRCAKKHDYGKMILVVLLLLAFVIAVNGIYIICPQEDAVYALMTYAYSFFIIFPIVLLDCLLGEKKFENSGLLICLEYVSVCVAGIMIAVYCHFANAEYFSIQLSYEQATSYYTTLITQIKETEGYSDSMPIVFVGENKKIEDETLYKNEIMDIFDMSGRDDTLVESYTMKYLLRYYCGFDPEYGSVSEIDQKIVNQMPIYPKDGSIKIYNNSVIVKLSE